MKRTYSLEEAQGVAKSLEIDFATSGFDPEQFRSGLNVEAEHGEADLETNVTDDDPLTTGKIALAHLNEIPDYYTRLSKMEVEASNGPAATSDAALATKNQRLAKGIKIGLVLVVFGLISSRLYRRNNH